MWEQFLESLLNLILQYKLSGDDEILYEILKRLNGWIITIITMMKKRWRYLESVELRELFQTAVVGVLVMISRLPKDETSVKLAQRAKAYIVAEIRKTYGNYWFEIPISQLFEEYEDVETGLAQNSSSRYLFVKPYCDDVEEFYAKDFYENLYLKLVRLGIITDREFRCLSFCYIDGLPHKQIAQNEKISRTRIVQIIKEARQKIRKYMNS